MWSIEQYFLLFFEISVKEVTFSSGLNVKYYLTIWKGNRNETFDESLFLCQADLNYDLF